MNKSALSQLALRTSAPPISWLMQMSLARPNLISLAAGFTDSESLPVTEVRQLMAEVLKSKKPAQAALQYGSTQGDPALRRLTAGRLRESDASKRAVGNETYSPERAIITSGSQQLLYIVTEALCDPGDIVLVEDPTYFVYLGIVESRGLRARGVRMESDGVDLDHLERTLESLKRSGDLHRLKLLYLVSYFQNPTGITTALEKKARALELLRQYERKAGHPIYVLEDAAYRELRFRGPDVPSSLAVRGGPERVIYAGTYSKPFATGTRVGFGILPEPVFTSALRIKGNHDFGTSNLLQQLLARSLSSGLYERHLRDLRKRYAAKADVMGKALRTHFPEQVRWSEADGGLYFWARLPDRAKTGVSSKIFKAAWKAEVLYVPGELCYGQDPTRAIPGNEMRLSFGSAGVADIKAGVTRLGEVLRRALRGG